MPLKIFFTKTETYKVANLRFAYELLFARETRILVRFASKNRKNSQHYSLFNINS